MLPSEDRYCCYSGCRISASIRDRIGPWEQVVQELGACVVHVLGKFREQMPEILMNFFEAIKAALTGKALVAVAQWG